MSEQMVSEKDILVEASRSYLPQDVVWELLAELGIGTGEVPAETVRSTVLKYAEANAWPKAGVHEVLVRLGVESDTESPE